MKDAHEKGAYDAVYERRDAEARAKNAVLLTKGPTGVAKVKERKKNCKSADLSRKRKKRQEDGLVQKLALLTEEGVALLGRLGSGGSKLLDDDDDDGDEYGGRLEEDDYLAGAAALQALRAKKDKTPADKEAIRKANDALSKIRTRARKRVKLEKDQERAKALTGRVEELETEVCLLEDALSVI